MILQELSRYYDRLAEDPKAQIARPGYTPGKIGYCIVLERSGEFHSVTPLRVQEGKRNMPISLLVPDRGGRSGTLLKPNFLWDNTGYVLGRDSKGKPARSREAFQAFSEFHLAQRDAIKDPGYRAVCNFLEGWKPAAAEKTFGDDWEGLLDDNVVFKLRAEKGYVHESPAVRAAWEELRQAEVEGPEGFCLISGQRDRLARLHPLIQGVAGAQTMGAAIVSFNLDAFESYNKEQSFNAPVGLGATFKYTTALEKLLSDRDRRLQIGDATVVFWAERPTPAENWFGMILGEQPSEDPDRVRQIGDALARIRIGEPITETHEVRDDRDIKFFILGLSPNASRLSIRFWLQSTVGELLGRLRQHLQDTELDGVKDGEVLLIRRIVAATGRAEVDARGRLKGYDRDAIPPLLAGAIARAVLTGGPYPAMLLTAMLSRIRADHVINHPRVAAIKACLVRNSRIQGQPKEVPVALDKDRTEAAYVIGRLFALLEKIQTDSAGGDLNATIKDRYFSSAGATPGVVFPRLIRLSQHHLAKMETPQKIYYEKLVGEVMGKLTGFPHHLHLEDQGLFAVGYFHQRQDLFTKKEKEGDSK